MDRSGKVMGASVASASDQPKDKRPFRLRSAGAAARAKRSVPPNRGSEDAKVVKKARVLKRHGARTDGAAEDVANEVEDDGAKVVGEARVLKRRGTPDLTNLCLKRAWFAATSLDGLSGVFIPTVKKQGYEYATIAPTSSKWFNKLCFGVSYYKSINGNATREVLLRIWRGVEQQLGEAPKDF